MMPGCSRSLPGKLNHCPWRHLPFLNRSWFVRGARKQPDIGDHMNHESAGREDRHRRRIYPTVLFFVLVLALLVACPLPPPHPTRPTKVDCPVEVEARFSALIDNTVSIGPPTSDPLFPAPSACDTQGPGILVHEWTQVGRINVPICVAAGTTSGQAASYCSSRLASIGFRVGGAAPAPPASPPGPICPGSLIVLSSRIIALGGNPVLHPDECREGTSWPLLP